MTKKEENFTSPIKCFHCGNVAPMEVVTSFSQVKEVGDDPSHPPWEEGPVWQLLNCPACSDITLKKVYYHEMFDPDDLQEEILYPVCENKILGLPKEVFSAFEAASKVKNIDPNAYAVLLGRVLDKVCIDRKANGDSLAERIQDLAKKNEIPKHLADMANQLKDLRNIGAHANLGDLTKEEIPMLSDLCKAILEYVYTAPALIEKVNKHFQKLKQKK